MRRKCHALWWLQKTVKGRRKNAHSGGQHGQGIVAWHQKQIQRNREWVQNFWGNKSSGTGASDPAAGHPATADELDPLWHIAKYLCRWSRSQYEAAPQPLIDLAVAESLGISRTHVALMRQGIHNEQPILPDALIKSDGSYPWATPEIHTFWGLLDSVSVDHLTRIGEMAGKRKTEFEKHWREIHKVVAERHPDHEAVLFRAATAPIHPCAPRYADDFYNAKVQATFELIAAPLAAGSFLCRSLGLFGFKSPADLLKKRGEAASHPPEIRE